MGREGREGKTVFRDSFFLDSLDLFFLSINIGIGVEVKAYGSTRFRSLLISSSTSSCKQQKHHRDRSIVFSRFTLLLTEKKREKVRPQGTLRGRLSLCSFAFHLSIRKKNTCIYCYLYSPFHFVNTFIKSVADVYR